MDETLDTLATELECVRAMRQRDRQDDAALRLHEALVAERLREGEEATALLMAAMGLNR